jgi:hypothetical protein
VRCGQIFAETPERMARVGTALIATRTRSGWLLGIVGVHAIPSILSAWDGIRDILVPPRAEDDQAATVALLDVSSVFAGAPAPTKSR